MKQLSVIIYGVVISLCLTSCEGCTKQAAKKATSLSLSVIEGVSEAVNERGEEVAEKTTDALGLIAKGTGKSIERQLNEHAEYVASVAGRTLVQTVEGLDKGVVNEYYTSINTENDLCEDVSLDYFGKINSKPVIDAYFIISKTGTYKAEFDFLDSANHSLMKKTAEINKTDEKRGHSLVCFALNDDEMSKLSNSSVVKVSVKR